MAARDNSAQSPWDYAASLVEDDIAARQGGLRPIIPLYTYPSFFGSDWDTLPALPYGVVIANPASGPGTSANSDYTREINAVRGAGMPVLGYVTLDVGSGAGTRTQQDVLDDVDNWHSFYDVDGIFFDLAPTGANGDKTAYFSAVCDHAHSKTSGQLVVANPGTHPLADAYVAPADVICTWEGAYADYLNAEVPEYASGWYSLHPPSKYLHLIHGTPSAVAMRAAADHAASMGVRWFYATHAAGAWTALATWHGEQVTHLKKTRVMLDPLDRRNHTGVVSLSAVEGLSAAPVALPGAGVVTAADIRAALITLGLCT